MKKPSYPRTLYKTTAKTFRTVKKYHWKYRNLIYLVISFVAAYFILRTDAIVSFIHNLGLLGFPAAFIAGMFFTYGLTTVPATVAIYSLAQAFNPFLIAFIGAFGSVVSDYLIFRFVKDRLAGEIIMLSKEINRIRKPISSLVLEEEMIIRTWKKISKSKIWNVLIPVIAGFIIASPLPDELGAAMFGAIKFDLKKFIVISYLLNFTGILIIGLSSRVFS